MLIFKTFKKRFQLNAALKDKLLNNKVNTQQHRIFQSTNQTIKHL